MVASDVTGSHLAYDACLGFFRLVVNIFFREIRPRGAFNIPKDGPVIFVVAPHNNQFLDPALVASEAFREAHRRPSFLIAAKSMHRRGIGQAAKLMDSIPVARAADDAKAGVGRIIISSDDPCLVLGHGTSFTKYSPKMQLMLSKSVGSPIAEILEVISDTELRIKKDFSVEGAKKTARILEKLEEVKTANNSEGLDYKVLPFVDQGVMYKDVYHRLIEGGSIAIFPEGGSHDRTDLLPLKAGVSIMALGAMASDPSVRVRVVPVGLSYFHAHKFRSRAVVEFGTALDVPSELVDKFKEGGTNKREACAKLLDLIYDGLKTVTVRTPDYETLMLIQAGRRLYKTPGQHLTLGQVVELNKRFIDGYMHFQHEPRMQEFKAEVLKYNRTLRDLGLKDHQVPRAQKATWKTLGLLTYRVGLLAVWTTFAFPGIVLNGPIFILAKLISKKKQREALAASTVKIAARDVIASWKVLITLGLVPFLYVFYAFLSTILTIKAGAPLRWRIWAPFITMAALPFITFSALKFGEAGVDVAKSLRPLIIALLPGQQQQLDKLKAWRRKLSNELTDLVNTYAPQIYEDFDEWRISVPSSSAPPPSSGNQGVWRRKSGTGGVDAQGHLLVHPMTWLDERLFGWSRSAKRGTNAWAGPSTEASRAHTPEASDDEEEDVHGDYDDVVGFIPGYLTPSNRNRSRSLANSYADLHQLKKSSEQQRHAHPEDHHLTIRKDAPTSMSPTPSGNGVDTSNPQYSPGGTRRNRRGSLSDKVWVETLATREPTETFKDATDDINREINIRRRNVGSAEDINTNGDTGA